MTPRRLAPTIYLAASVLLLAACSGSPPARSPTAATSPSTSGAHPTTTVTPTTVTPTTVTPDQPSQRLAGVAFFNPRQGYGLFQFSNAEQCAELVGATSDGGATFHALTIVTSGDCSVASEGSLAFDDHGDGFLYGPGLFVTHDGGARWVALPQPGTVLSAQALGYFVWMLQADCAGRSAPPSLSSPPGPCPLRLSASDDGGLSWRTLPLPANAVLAGDAFSGLEGQTWLVRLSASEAYVVTDPPNSPSETSDEAPFWVTADGGRSWSPREVACGMGALSVVVSAAPDGTLLAVCDTEPSAGTQLKSAVRSTDGGMTWQEEFVCPVTNASPDQACLSAPLNFGYLGSIDATSADTAFLVGGRSSLMVTHDGGAQWAVVMPPIGGTDDGTQQVIFFNQQNGLVLGVDGNNDEAVTIWHTSDGGAHWSSVVSQVMPQDH
ncbi:MAG TPA: sialidase family protein [Acidimicrobiales bacterium]